MPRHSPTPTSPPTPATPRTTARPLTAAIAALTLTGCAADTDSAPSHTVTDSAGVAIVHSHRPAWGDGAGTRAAWRISAEPRLEIGALEGEDPYLLQWVLGVTVLDDGGVVLTNHGDNTVRFYDARGRFVRSVGGTGEGPGEYSQPSDLRRFGDSIWIRDSGRRYNVYDLTGELLAERRLPRQPPPGVRYAFPSAMFADGSVVMVESRGSPMVGPGPAVDSATLFRVSGDDPAHPAADPAAGGRWDTLAVVPTRVRLPFEGSRTGITQAMSPGAVRAVGPAHVYHGFPETYEVTVRDTAGRVVRVIRADIDPPAVTDARIVAYREATLHYEDEYHPLTPDLLERRRQQLDAQVYPDRFPAYERLLVDPAGNLWIERTDPDNPTVTTGFNPVRDRSATWDVFDPAGAWLGSLDLPARFYVKSIGEDWLAGVWKDEMEVEIVRVYGIEKGLAR